MKYGKYQSPQPLQHTKPITQIIPSHLDLKHFSSVNASPISHSFPNHEPESSRVRLHRNTSFIEQNMNYSRCHVVPHHRPANDFNYIDVPPSVPRSQEMSHFQSNPPQNLRLLESHLHDVLTHLTRIETEELKRKRDQLLYLQKTDTSNPK